MNLIPALSNGGMVSIVSLIAKKLEPLIIHSVIRISHILERFRGLVGVVVVAN